MTSTTTSQTVNIRPEVSVLSVFPHLNYKPWYAVAEFVDNAIQSFFTHRLALAKVEGEQFRLSVDIKLSVADGGQIVIRDNAAGIQSSEYHRAFKTAAVPRDRSGLSEFGVGMKSAACWFANEWSVRTSALGEDVERFITFDVTTIVENSIEELTLKEAPASFNDHFTEIILRNLHSIPQGRTVSKIKEHLASIYRIFIRDGLVQIKFNDDLLTHTQPNVLTAGFYKNEGEPPRVWRKEIALDFGEGQHVYGFAALRETASTSGAGFALFRRNRLIQGSADDGYRPEYIFKKANSFIYQRLFGELHVEGFDVSHTKDGIRWAEHEDIFLEFLKEKLNEEPLPLLDQAAGYRVRPKQTDLKKGAQTALNTTARVIEEEAPPVIEGQLQNEPEENSPPLTLPQAAVATERVISIDFADNHWKVVIELTTDPAVGDWLSISDSPAVQNNSEHDGVRQLEIRLSLAHPFMDRFAGPEPEQIEPLLRVAAGLALSEVTAREGGVRKVGTVRRYLNELLREALSKP